MVKLLKFKNGVWKFADYGVRSLADLYCKQGYLVEY